MFNGELLKETELGQGKRNDLVNLVDEVNKKPNLKDIGITRNQSSNWQRIAKHYKHMKEKYDYTVRNLSERYGMGKSYYHQKLELLELPEKIINQLSARADSLTETHCRHICKLVNEEKLKKNKER